MSKISFHITGGVEDEDGYIFDDVTGAVKVGDTVLFTAKAGHDGSAEAAGYARADVRRRLKLWALDNTDFVPDMDELLALYRRYA